MRIGSDKLHLSIGIREIESERVLKCHLLPLALKKKKISILSLQNNNLMSHEHNLVTYIACSKVLGLFSNQAPK